MRRYRMSAAFYWYRLWLAVEKDTREDIDKSWAPTDALMHIAAEALLAALAYLAVASGLGFVALLRQHDMPMEAKSFALIGAAALIGSYLPYRLSLSGHIRNGELFKSLFDVERAKLKDLEGANEAERQRWYRVWNELQHGRAMSVPEDSVLGGLGAFIRACSTLSKAQQVDRENDEDSH